MVMDFWEAQRKARRYTAIYVTIFIILTLIIAAGAEFAMRTFAEENYQPPLPYIAMAFLAITFMVTGYNYLMYKQFGGGYVAKSLGGRQIGPNSSSPQEFQLYNIVQEIALATSLPMPEVYILPSNEINAFAAGLSRDTSAIAITDGALRKLNRDEVQGVIAHEFGHVSNGDMVISLRLAAMVMGFFFALYIGLRLMQISSFGDRRSDNRQGNPLLVAALIFMVAGAITWFFGSILKAMISRQREYLADACAVQFTRNPEGIANALRKIAGDEKRGKPTDMPKTGGAYAHMYFEDRSSLFATHPPIWKRIAAIEGKTYLDEDVNP